MWCVVLLQSLYSLICILVCQLGNVQQTAVTPQKSKKHGKKSKYAALHVSIVSHLPGQAMPFALHVCLCCWTGGNLLGPCVAKVGIHSWPHHV